MNKKRVFWTIGVIVLAGIIIGGAQLLKGRGAEEETEPPERPVKLMTVTGAAMSERRVFPGRLKASQTVELAFEVSGRLQELPVREGDVMERGQLVARLDQRDFQNQVAADQARFDKAQADLSRYEELFEEEMIAASELEVKQTDFEVTRAALEVSRKALEDSEIRAPFDGILARRYVENLEQIQAKEIVALYQDQDNVEIIIDVPESVVARAPQYDVTFSAQFSPERIFPMELKEFATQADTVTKTFAATLIMPRPEGVPILPGMTVSVNVDLERIVQDERSAYLIPLTAIIYDAEDRSAAVWVFDESKGVVESREVETLGVTGELVEVTSGLEDGDEVVIAGASFLFENQKVRRFEG